MEYDYKDFCQFYEKNDQLNACFIILIILSYCNFFYKHLCIQEQKVFELEVSSKSMELKIYLKINDVTNCKGWFLLINPNTCAQWKNYMKQT